MLFNIGILQLTQNLDDAVKGFKAGLAKLNLSVKFHYLNADGNINELPKLAQKLADDSVDLIFACSTPAAKAAKDLTADIPVVFTPVFDPVAAKLVDSLEQPGGKLTGMSGMVSAAEKINFIKELLPEVKKIAVLYNINDNNSLIEKENFSRAVGTTLEITEIPFAKQEDLSLLEEKLSSDLSAVFLPIGRAAEENFSTIAYYTDAVNIPIIASHAPNVPLGALGALSADHFALGEACAAKAKSILVDKQAAGSIPIGITEKPEIFLNEFVAETVGVTIPSGIIAKAKEIYN